MAATMPRNLFLVISILISVIQSAGKYKQTRFFAAIFGQKSTSLIFMLSKAKLYRHQTVIIYSPCGEYMCWKFMDSDL
ncbi:MAG TPA: hypothetical protein DCG57_14180 [Candidatus Riflebacteria bacterium]|nr:hypothetical protein [Candidatus Riflebacteria bacterium]